MNVSPTHCSNGTPSLYGAFSLSPALGNSLAKWPINTLCFYPRTHHAVNILPRCCNGRPLCFAGDTSQVTTLKGTFNRARVFNGDISQCVYLPLGTISTAPSSLRFMVIIYARVRSLYSARARMPMLVNGHVLYNAAATGRRLCYAGNTSKVTTLYATFFEASDFCLLYTSPSPRDRTRTRMPSSA